MTSANVYSETSSSDPTTTPSTNTTTSSPDSTTQTTTNTTNQSTSTSTTPSNTTVMSNSTAAPDLANTSPPLPRWSSKTWWLLAAVLAAVVVVVAIGVIYYHREQTPYRRYALRWDLTRFRFLRNWRARDDEADNIILQLEQPDYLNGQWPPRISFA